MKKVLIALSLLAFMPSVALANHITRVNPPTGRFNCLTVSINGKKTRYCAGTDMYIISKFLFKNCGSIGGRKRELYCLAPSDSGALLTVVPDEIYE